MANNSPLHKPSTTVPQQLQLLIDRGLIITNQVEVEQYLKVVGYYRLSGYTYVFQSDKVNHIFQPNTNWDQIRDLYNFDRELRLLLLDAFERIEVGLRILITNSMCDSHQPDWYSDETLFSRLDLFDSNLDSIEKELDRSQEVFIQDHDQRYGRAIFPPAWKTFQVLSFGTLSKIYSSLRNDLPGKLAIAKKVGLFTPAFLTSWMTVVSILRNFCAHHSRLAYRTYRFPPRDLYKTPLPWLRALPPLGDKARNHLYYQLCAVRYFLNTFDPNTDFNTRLKFLITKYPSVSIRHMGFPINWDTEPLWR